MTDRGKTVFMHLGNIVNTIVKLFESSLPDPRTAEGAEMKAEIVSDIGDLKQFPIKNVNSEPFLDQVDVCGISTN